ncbi:hypothetical protein Ciccas_002130 [Cichlidogyrus casuarinus]|uniref:Uncharacterized protein n=1 Tax=Cichlidogyrus casuarinus TaxID=1844966 RepID=A0ABD2QIP7_9PLAT
MNRKETADKVGDFFFNRWGMFCYQRYQVKTCKRWRLWFCTEYQVHEETRVYYPLEYQPIY